MQAEPSFLLQRMNRNSFSVIHGYARDCTMQNLNLELAGQPFNPQSYFLPCTMRIIVSTKSFEMMALKILVQSRTLIKISRSPLWLSFLVNNRLFGYTIQYIDLWRYLHPKSRGGDALSLPELLFLPWASTVLYLSALISHAVSLMCVYMAYFSYDSKRWLGWELGHLS